MPRSLPLVLVVLAASALAGAALAGPPEPTTRRIALDEKPELVTQLVLGGASEGGTPRMMDAAAGDLDGDGIDDLVLGAPGADPNDVAAAGSVYVLFGRSDLLSGRRQVDLTRVDAFDLRIDGAVPGARLGYRIAIADVDGDGLNDLITTAPGRRGAVYVKLGRDKWPRGTMVIGPPDTYDIAFVGPAEDSLLGATLCVGDLDADARADLVFASLGFDEQQAVVSTDLHVVPGRSEWQKEAFGIDGRIAGRVRLTRRVAPGTRAVHNCALGDLDDDGSGDVVAAMPLDRGGDTTHPKEEAGTVAVVHDILTRSGGVIDLGDETLDWGFRVVGDQTGAHFGEALAVADLNADGRDDLIVGSPDRLVAGPRSEGAVHVFWGGLLPKAGTSVALASDLRLTGEGGRFGAVLQISDANGDGRDDLLVAAPAASTYAGERSGLVDIFIGGPHLNDADVPARRDKRIVGGGLGDGLGYAIASGDFDADGIDELVLRAAGNALERREAGTFYVINAELSSLAAENVIDELLPVELLGPGRGGRLLARVLRRDLDGDGVEELLWASPEGAGTRGLVCVVRTLPATLDLSKPEQCELRVLGPVDRTLSSFDAGDLDGDGRMEIVLGLDGRDLGGATSHAGAVLAARLPEGLAGEVVLDAPAKAGALPAEGALMRAWLGGQKAEGLGAQVDVVDLDGDGRAEVIMAADRASWEDRALAGTVLIAPGSAEEGKRHAWDVVSREAPGVQLRFEGTPGARLGQGTQVLDLDGDGRLDLALSAPVATLSAVEERGGIFVVYDVAGIDAGTYSLADPDIISLRIAGAARGAGLFGQDARDLDGDGADDLIVVSPWEQVEALQHGAGYVIYGQPGKRRGGTITLGADSSAELRVVDARGMRLTGLRVADLDGDAQHELIVSARPHTRADLRPTISLVETGSARPTGAVVLSRKGSVSLVIEGLAGSGGGLTLTTPLLDADGDGRPELWLIDSTADAQFGDQGAALRFALDALLLSSAAQ